MMGRLSNPEPEPPHYQSPTRPCYPCVPQVLATRILAVKASLCKLSTATAARACDFYAKLLLIAISSTLKSLLRPHVLNTPDKSPGDRLTEICAKNTDTGETRWACPTFVFMCD